METLFRIYGPALAHCVLALYNQAEEDVGIKLIWSFSRTPPNLAEILQ